MRSVRTLVALSVCLVLFLAPPSFPFDYSRYVLGPPSTLSVWVQEIDSGSGEVLLNGVDSQGPPDPFTWIWGDGDTTEGWFPQSHVYGDTGRNYVARVVSHYPGGETDTALASVLFVPPEVSPIPLPDAVGVAVPDTAVALSSHWPGYEPPAGLTGFEARFFGVVSRETIEYVLSLASFLQMDLVHSDVFLVDGGFRQVVQRDSTFGGMYSLWFTSPVAFVSGDGGLSGGIAWTSFLHEMGHNYTLNAPADHHYGGRIDGDANAIYSETMAQVFQHATAYELVNGAAGYGLGDDLATDIMLSAVESMKLVRASYDEYVSGGMPYASWNDPGTPEDETFLTFMTLAFKFFEHAETSGLGYEAPVKGMTAVLQGFGPEWESLYDHLNDTADADSFRATFMVTAIGNGFREDLRDEFRALGFPVSDRYYDLVTGALTSVAAEGTAPGAARVLALARCAPNPTRGATEIVFDLAAPGRALVRVFDVSGRRLATLVDRDLARGRHAVPWSGADAAGRALPSGAYVIELRAGGTRMTQRVVLVR